MSKTYVAEDTCSFKVGIYYNSSGNIVQGDETPASTKNMTFGGFTSSITAAEAINDDDDSPAIHNGVSGLMWLLSGQDDNFDQVIRRTFVEEINDV